ncbi:hypothetical protein EWB00_011144 [Schistosoma japonicum]|uniref:Uncharacterized protein n=1 Tax=Schistosoma japonicum TaxID=6182 RepID=A0A4Z2DLX8_SCHJA|nr:hypothetical protein EWB00_011144 [Schistosoma japonicum]
MMSIKDIIRIGICLTYQYLICVGQLHRFACSRCTLCKSKGLECPNIIWTMMNPSDQSRQKVHVMKVLKKASNMCYKKCNENKMCIGFLIPRTSKADGRCVLLQPSLSLQEDSLLPYENYAQYRMECCGKCFCFNCLIF